MSTRFPQAELTEVPEDIAAKILEIQEKSGFVPNVFLMFARRPAEFRAFFAYHDALAPRSDRPRMARRFEYDDPLRVHLWNHRLMCGNACAGVLVLVWVGWHCQSNRARCGGKSKLNLSRSHHTGISCISSIYWTWQILVDRSQ